MFRIVSLLAIVVLSAPADAQFRRARSGSERFSQGNGDILRVPGPLAGTEVDDLLRSHNATRASHNAGYLVINDKLAAAAQAWATESAATRKGGHEDRYGRWPWHRAIAAGYTAVVNENAAEGPIGGQHATDLWMSEPSIGHKENLINQAWREVGFGIADSADGVRYWVALYGAGEPSIADAVAAQAASTVALMAETLAEIAEAVCVDGKCPAVASGGCSACGAAKVNHREKHVVRHREKHKRFGGRRGGRCCG